MASYAAGTEVPVSRSIGEMEKLVNRHGATGFGYGRDHGRIRIGFRIADRFIRFDVAEPALEDYLRTPKTRVRRSDTEAVRFREQEERRRVRALHILVKALLTAVAEGIISLNEAFLPYTLLPAGVTVGEFVEPQIDVAYATGEMPSLLPGGTAPAAIEGRS